MAIEAELKKLVRGRISRDYHFYDGIDRARESLDAKVSQAVREGRLGEAQELAAKVGELETVILFLDGLQVVLRELDTTGRTPMPAVMTEYLQEMIKGGFFRRKETRNG